jgi:hypothetical protein
MTQDDADLVKRVLAGEKAAFGPLINRYGLEALRLARRMLGDTFDAEGVTQEVLLQAFLGLRTLRAHRGDYEAIACLGNIVVYRFRMGEGPEITGVHLDR